MSFKVAILLRCYVVSPTWTVKIIICKSKFANIIQIKINQKTILCYKLSRDIIILTQAHYSSIILTNRGTQYYQERGKEVSEG